ETYWEKRDELVTLLKNFEQAKPKPTHIINSVSDTIIQIDNIFTSTFKTRFLSQYLHNGNFTYIDLSCWRFGKNPERDNFDIYGLLQTLLTTFEESNRSRLHHCLEKIVISDIPPILELPSSLVDSYTHLDEVLISIAVNENENTDTKKKFTNILPR